MVPQDHIMIIYNLWNFEFAKLGLPLKNWYFHMLCEMFYNLNVVCYEMVFFTLREALGNVTLYFGTRPEMISPTFTSWKLILKDTLPNFNP